MQKLTDQYSAVIGQRENDIEIARRKHKKPNQNHHDRQEFHLENFREELNFNDPGIEEARLKELTSEN